MTEPGAVPPARLTIAAFAIALFSSATLLFMIQPQYGRLVLPLLGGGPMVWATALVFFQTALLAGYLYAHLLQKLPLKAQLGVHLALLIAAGLTLPISVPADVTPSATYPALWLLGFMAMTVGLPFLALSAQAPLLQRWLLAAAPGANPYPLYAASNAGSLIGLLGYPLLIEPRFDLASQGSGWTLAYWVMTGLIALTAILAARGHASSGPTVVTTPAPGWRDQLSWLVLAALPSGLLVAVTTHLTTDMVALPLMWVPPLALYILTFIIVFAARPIPSIGTALYLAPFALILFAASLYHLEDFGAIWGVVICLSLYFLIILACHGALVARRPDPQHLTGFYLIMSLGGAIGGGATALLPPMLFTWKPEIAILTGLAAAALAWVGIGPAMRRSLPRPFQIFSGERWKLLGDILIPTVTLALSWLFVNATPGADPLRRAMTLVPLLGGLILLTYVSRRQPVRFGLTIVSCLLAFGLWGKLIDGGKLYSERNFFGAFYVRDYPSSDARLLVHGTTVHGAQSLSPTLKLMPLTYYAPGSGVADVLKGSSAPQVGLVGLGTGALACYATPGQTYTFFEIDPAMVDLATKSGLFTYVPQCTPKARIVIGDARLTLAREPNGKYDVLVIDAFTSDAIPLHMITAEAFAMYRAKLKPDGVLLVHISNRVLDLKPVLAAVAEAKGWQTRILTFEPDDGITFGQYVTQSVWVAFGAPNLTRAPFDADAALRGWEALPAKPGFRLWTDSYANVLGVVKDD
jgi:SAM-dependent methyltransferase